ncbi:MAG: PIN domain-containing protein [Verrucomicrobia bacterium]|nr:PIN domain-containing protein [Verrucomicrobiota bacterium]
MKSRFILDTGPLVAWLCPRDEHHGWVRKAFAQMPAQGMVCEAVLAEVCHLAAKDGIACGKVMEFVERGRLTPVSLAGELSFVRRLLEQYADAPMDFADACVVRLAEIHADALVCTTDRDFQFYRRNGRDPISLIAPFAG